MLKAKTLDKITLTDEIINKIYKLWYSFKVLTLIKNREESYLYLSDYDFT